MKQELLDKMHEALKEGKLTRDQVVFYIFELMADMLESHENSIDDILRRLSGVICTVERDDNVVSDILERLDKLEGK